MANSKPGFFKRIFKYPASSNRPTENLATEVTAFFLDHYPPLLQAFLSAIDDQCEKTAFSKAEGRWKIGTQKQLDADHGRADLVLWVDNPQAKKSDDPPTHKIVVEVKIDARPSHPLQTQWYADHLKNLHTQHQTETALVLLTKWKPSGDFARPCSAKFLFKDFKKLLREASPSDDAAERAISFFAQRWAEYLEEEWCIPDITHAHLASLGGTPTSPDIETIRKYLWQMLDSTVDALTSHGWRRQTISRSKDGAGRYQVWGRQLNRDGDDPQKDFIQLGCDFGAGNSNKPVMRGFVYLHGRYSGRAQQLSNDIEDWHGPVAMLRDILSQGIPASNPGEPIEDTELAEQLQKHLVEAVRKLEIP